jgi:YD repeat-containing protein
MTLTQISPKKSQSRLGVKLVCTAVFLLPLQEIRACGDWSLPQNHFEGVNSTGFVDLWEQIGTLDLGEIKVPVNIGFQTYLPYVSKELGAGWILPLLDANIVQRDEGTFDMVQPDGWIALFRRDGSNPNILHGSGGMLAEIQGSTITVNSTCGSGWKMVFTQGKLTSLSKGKHTLSIERDDLGRGVAIRDGITPVMRLEQDQATGLAKSIQIGPQKYQLAYDGKPRIENVGGQNLVGGVEPSLHQITYPQEMGGKKETYDFAVTDKMLPDLKITDAQGKERMIVWGCDGKILQDGEWAYKITPGSDARANAAIERTNPQKQMEYWFKDEERGQETTLALDGTKEIKNWFTSGMVAGAIRKKEKIIKGVSKVMYQASYNEKGKLFRELLENGEVNQFAYAEDGNKTKQIQHSKSGELKDTIEYQKGRIAVVRSVDGRTTQYFYDDLGRETKMLINDSVHSETSYATDGSWMKLVVYDKKSGKPSRTFFTEIDARGRALTERITEHSGGYPEIFRTFFYDEAGRLKKKTDSQQGAIEYLDGPDGRRMAQLLK